ncbi:hypothetical protein C8Q79DRAFT_943084 [Trametes meyenii]|nr:hypothetical protein C8Q79DRAFT_943084 [Trametes meyenii]
MKASRPKDDSLLEKHAIESYPFKPVDHPPSLSVYELPTATFMWPRFTPKAVEPSALNPVMYVQYRPQQQGSQRPSSSSGESTSSSPGMNRSSSMRCTTPIRTSHRKRGSSDESDDGDIPASPSDRFLKHPRTSHFGTTHRVSSERSTATAFSSAGGGLLPRPAEQDLRRTFRTLGLAPGASASELRPESVPQAPHHSNSGHATTLPRSAAPAVVNAYPLARKASADRVEDPAETEWKKYCTPNPDLATGTGIDFKCTWQLSDNGTFERCTYAAKKHLVKRHIASKHLQLRPCKCHICGKSFAQKSNLDTHLNTHTGLAPHQCHYCTLRFKDPARRHRHMTHVHGHKSSRTKKGRMAAAMAQSSPEASEHEAGPSRLAE